MTDIFVSYRRSDSSDVTGRIFDQLRQQFGESHLFKDVESIPLGTDFRKVISRAVQQCDVLLAVIGRHWLEATDDSGKRRIDDPNDFVHLEISAALERDIPVIPVLVQDVSMPKAKELPAALQPLAYRNAAKVRTDPDFHNDMAALCAQLIKHLDGKLPTPAEQPPVESRSSPAARTKSKLSDRSNRSVSIGGNATGNVIQTGDNNVASLKFTQTTLPPAGSVDIQAEFAALRELLARLQSPDQKKIGRALEDAQDELTKEAPDRDAFGEALDRALKYGQQAEGFAAVAEKLQGHVANAVAWLGDNWHKLLPLVGLVL